MANFSKMLIQVAIAAFMCGVAVNAVLTHNTRLGFIAGCTVLTILLAIWQIVCSALAEREK